MGSSARVGEHADVGARGYIGARATLSDGADALDGVVLGADATIGRRSIVGAGVTAGTDLQVGRAVDIGDDTTFGDSTAVGYGSQIGAGATLGTNVIIGSLVQVAAGADLDDRVVLARQVDVRSGVQIASDTVIGPNTQVFDNVVIGSDVRIRKDVTIEAGAQVARDARIGRDVVIRAGARIEAEAVIGSGAEIGAYAVIAEGERIDRNATVEPGGIIVVGGARRFPGGDVAPTCADYAASSEFQGAEAVSGLYTIDYGYGEHDVYCDMTPGNAGWTRFGPTFPGIVAGAECKSGTGTFDANDRITMSAVVGGTNISTHSGCGLSSGAPFPYQRIRVTNLSMTPNAVCGNVPFPNVVLQAVVDSDGPRTHYNDTYYPGHNYESADSTTQSYLSWSQAAGQLSEGVVFDAGSVASRYIHTGVASFSGCHDRPASLTLWMR